MIRRYSSFCAAWRFAAAAALCVSILVLASHAFAAAFVAQVVKVRGDIRIAREGSGEMSASIGTALQLGDVIKTGAGARVRLRFVDGSILALGEMTTLSIDIFAVDAGNKSRTVVLSVLEGIVNAAAAKSGEAQFDYQIKTANGYSAVRGTKWILSFQQALMTLYVLNGVVEMGGNGDQPPVMVNAGEWGSVGADGTVSPPQPTTPDMLKPVLDATDDTAMNTVPPPSTTPAPSFTPTYPDNQNNRAFKKGSQSGEKGGGGSKSDHDRGQTGN